MATNRKVIFRQLWIILFASYLMSSVAFITSVTTTPNIATPRTSGLSSCTIYTLPVVGSDYFNRDYELVCSWNPSQSYQAQFIQRSNGETIDNYLTFPDRIISRVNGSKNINCRLSLRNSSLDEINRPCIKENIPSFIRVDPFVTDVDEGSSAVFTCTFNDGGRRSQLSWRVHSNGNLSATDRDRSKLYPNVNFVVYKQKDGKYLQVECNLYGNRNMSSYGLLRIIEGTTLNLTTPSGVGQTNLTTDRQSVRTVIFSTDQATSALKRGFVVIISVSISGAGIIILLSIAIVSLLRKQKRISLPRRLSEDDKTDAIELSHIPHIKYEESSELYALSVKDKRLQEQQSDDLIVKHHDESDQRIPILSSSLGIPALHPLESIDENVYAEPDVSEEPIYQTISRQQCTLTPLPEDDQ